MHRIRTKINAAGPFHASEIGIDGDGVKDARVQQFQKYSASSLWFDWENPTQTVIESHFQPVVRERFGGNNPNHAVTLIQWLNFGRLLIPAGLLPGRTEFGAMERGP